MRPVQAAAVAGSHTSNLISESEDGRAVPCTRQNDTLTGLPLMVPGGVIAAEVIVHVSGAGDVSALQSVAAQFAPDAAASANATAAPLLLVPSMSSPGSWLLRPSRRL